VVNESGLAIDNQLAATQEDGHILNAEQLLGVI
jgi:hypothetical protein